MIPANLSASLATPAASSAAVIRGEATSYNVRVLEVHKLRPSATFELEVFATTVSGAQSWLNATWVKNENARLLYSQLFSQATAAQIREHHVALSQCTNAPPLLILASFYYSFIVATRGITGADLAAVQRQQAEWDELVEATFKGHLFNESFPPATHPKIGPHALNNPLHTANLTLLSANHPLRRSERISASPAPKKRQDTPHPRKATGGNVDPRRRNNGKGRFVLSRAYAASAASAASAAKTDWD